MAQTGIKPLSTKGVSGGRTPDVNGQPRVEERLNSCPCGGRNRSITAPHFIEVSAEAAFGDGDGEVEGTGQDGQ